MRNVSPHERLIVYDKALSFVRDITPQVDLWPAIHSVRDQMDRACESLVVNLVKAAWHQRTDQGVYDLECSLGSTLECATCLDVACIKGFIEKEQATVWKQSLQEVACMEVGLRRSWSSSVCDGSSQYGDKEPVFPHESLQVYQRAIELCRLLAAEVLVSGSLKSRHMRRIDEMITSLLLNIAEGNGRFSQLDHRQFVATAEEAGVKLAAYLDLVLPTCPGTITLAKNLLHEVMAMLEGMKGYLDAR